MVLFFYPHRGAKKSWRKDAATCSSSGSGSTGKTFVRFSGGSNKNITETLNPVKQNCMVSFRGGSDSTGLPNIVSSVNITPFVAGADSANVSSGHDTGWRQNCSDSYSMVVQTSSSTHVTNLLEILSCNSTLIAESESSAECIRTEENDEYEHFKSTISVPTNNIPSDSNVHYGVSAHNSKQLPVAAESKEEAIVPVLLTSLDPCIDSLNSRDLLDFRNPLVSRDPLDSRDPLNSLDKIKYSSDSIGGDEASNSLIGNDGEGLQIQHDHCPYHLSDDGAFVFSTN